MWSWGFCCSFGHAVDNGAENAPGRVADPEAPADGAEGHDPDALKEE